MRVGPQLTTAAKVIGTLARVPVHPQKKGGQRANRNPGHARRRRFSRAGQNPRLRVSGFFLNLNSPSRAFKTAASRP